VYQTFIFVNYKGFQHRGPRLNASLNVLSAGSGLPEGRGWETSAIPFSEWVYFRRKQEIPVVRRGCPVRAG